MTTEKVVSNYTDEQTAQAVEAYLTGTSVEAIAETLGKSVRSVVAKLAQQKVYRAKEVATSKRVTKGTMVAQIAALAGVSTEQVASLEKADKAALEVVLGLVSKVAQ